MDWPTRFKTAARRLELTCIKQTNPMLICHRLKIDVGWSCNSICIVRSLSNTGTALEVVTLLSHPDRFTLIVQSDGRSRPCRLVCEESAGLSLYFFDRTRRLCAGVTSPSRNPPSPQDGFSGSNTCCGCSIIVPFAHA